MRRIWAVGRKEIRQISRDPLSLLMLLVLPVFMLLIFGYALDFDVENVALAIQDLDRSAASRRLVDAFTSTGKFRPVAWLAAEEDLGELLERRRALAVLVIPEGYSSELAGGRAARAQLILDGTDSNTATTVLGYLAGIEAAAGGASRPAGEGVEVTPIEIRPRVWYNPEFESSHFLVPGLIGFIMMLTAVLSTALSVVREKERGTLEQLAVAPINTLQILVGKTLPYLGVSLAAMALILTGARALFGVEVQGSYVDLALATLLFLAGGLGWGLLVSTLADSQAHAFQIGIFTALLPTMVLSGFVFPIRNMPEVLQLLTYVIPARFYLVILRGIILKGAGLGSYLDQMAWLGLYTLTVVGLATVRFSRRRL